MSLLKYENSTLQRLDKHLSRLIDKGFSYQKNFYEPNETNIQYIANTFNINIKNENFENAKILLEEALLKKSKAGTTKGLALVLEKLYGEIEVIKTTPFSFKIKAKTGSTDKDMATKARELVLENKPLRDVFEYIELKLEDMYIKSRVSVILKMRLDIR